MLTLLARLFIKNYREQDDPAVRSAYGALCGSFGIFLNALLFAGKLAAGLVSGSVAVTADSFNNLADAGSSLITLLGFKLARQRPDTEHPFGHGRIEYISGLLVSIAIILMGFELLKNAITEIVHPSDARFSPVIMVIIFVSVLVKLYMAAYNRKVGKKLNSSALLAASLDSISDSVATGTVLLAAVASRLINAPGISFDGWCGLLVSLFVLYSGVNSVKTTISPLLGRQPDAEFVKKIESIVLSFEGISAIHDLIVHDYGPGRIIISLHAEMPTSPNSDIFAMHDILNSAERRLRDELGCDATIHLDPVALGDVRNDMLKSMVCELLHGIAPELTLHDFRVAADGRQTKLLFDVVVPYKFGFSDEEVRSRICEAVAAISDCPNGHAHDAAVPGTGGADNEGCGNGNYSAVVTIDRA